MLPLLLLPRLVTSWALFSLSSISKDDLSRWFLFRRTRRLWSIWFQFVNLRICSNFCCGIGCWTTSIPLRFSFRFIATWRWWTYQFMFLSFWQLCTGDLYWLGYFCFIWLFPFDLLYWYNLDNLRLSYIIGMVKFIRLLKVTFSFLHDMRVFFNLSLIICIYFNIIFLFFCNGCLHLLNPEWHWFSCLKSLLHGKRHIFWSLWEKIIWDWIIIWSCGLCFLTWLA